MDFAKLFPLTPLARKFLQYVLSFGVTLGIGLVPLWGGDVIPRFRVILDVFPADLQDVIPWASLLMSVTAVGVQFFGGETMGRRLERGFKVTFVSLVILVLVLYGVYKKTVIRIEIPGAGKRVSYLIGSTFLPNCECARRGLDIRECIGFAITANPDEVSACYPLQQITTRGTTLSVLYMLVMFGLGVLIALLVLKGVSPRRARPRPRKGTAPADEPDAG